MNIENLTVSFGETKVLDKLSIHTEATGLYMITGSSGCGKTTLLRAILGLLPYEGDIENHGQLSALFQEPRLFDHLTALENVTVVMPTPDKNQAAELLNTLGLTDCHDFYPAELSGGMKQRVSLARALCYPFDTLLLDEPFSGLDSGNKSVIIPLLLSLAKEKLIIIVTHNTEDFPGQPVLTL